MEPGTTTDDCQTLVQLPFWSFSDHIVWQTWCPSVAAITTRAFAAENKAQRVRFCRNPQGSVSTPANPGLAHDLPDNAEYIQSKRLPWDNFSGTDESPMAMTEPIQTDEANARLAALVDSSDDAIISKNLDGIITSWNKSAERMFGYTAADAVGQPITMIAAADRPHEMQQILQRIRRGEKIDHFETVRRRRDGTEINVSLSVSPIRNAQGEIIGAAKIARDISQRIQAQKEREALLASERAARAEAERANRMKDEFLATVSHEIRTPLNAILGWAQLLQTGHVSDSELAEGLEIIERNSRAQAQLIDDLLDMSRLVSGKMRLEIKPVDLGAVIAAVLDTVRPSAEAKSIEITTDIRRDVPTLLADPMRIQQIIWNLLSNAIKFTPSDGKIQVRALRSGRQIELVVADTGQGISPAFLPYVFDRFQQADSSSRREHGGLGLGLAIVKQLVELHGGTVRAESAGLNRGATFRFTLPVAARGLPAQESPAPESAHENSEPTQPALLSGLKVLVVDDVADSRSLVNRILRKSGAAVLEASSAGDALDILSHEHPDVLLSDIGMPQLDGYDFIRQVRSLPRAAGSGIPAAALTAMARSEDRTRALLAGFQSHIAKPIDASELLAVVATLSGRSGV